MEKMLVTQGLNELKTLDSRINRAIRNSSFVASAKTSEKKVTPYITKEDFIKEAKSAMDSIGDLITRREAIKNAIVESNAKTQIEICGETYSVAKVIDMKNSISYKKFLLNTMKQQLADSQLEVERHNRAMEQKIDNLVATVYGKETKGKAEDYDSIVIPYREREEYSLVDPIGIVDKIDELERFIEEFESTVDSKLQVSNCITTIEF